MDLDLPFSLTFAMGGTIVFCSSLTVLAVVSWQVLIVAIPMVYFAIRMQVINRLIFKSYFNGHTIMCVCVLSRDTTLPWQKN